MSKFLIADLAIEVNSDNLDIIDYLNPFSCPDIKNPNLVIDVCVKDFLERPKGRLIIDQEVKWVIKDDLGHNLAICICRENSDEIVAMLETEYNWSKVRITYLSSSSDVRYALDSIVGIAVFYNLIHYNGIAIHASAVEYKGKGIIFTAPSDTGKTTMANLWKNHRGAAILNGDRPALRIQNGEPIVYGIPWSGSQHIYINGSAPLSAIIVLEQAKENKLRVLSHEEAIPRLIPRCFLPYYNENLMIKAIDNIEQIINKTPVYLLQCRPDKEAVEMVYKCVI